MGEITLHALRQTHASQWIDAGFDAGFEVVKIRRRPGQANPNIALRIYAHPFRQRDDKAGDVIDAALAGFGQS